MYLLYTYRSVTKVIEMITFNVRNQISIFLIFFDPWILLSVHSFAVDQGQHLPILRVTALTLLTSACIIQYNP